MRAYTANLLLLGVLLPPGVVVQDAEAPPKPAAILPFDSIGSYLWSGNSRLVVLGRRQYRRADIFLTELTPELKPTVISPPNDLRRFAYTQSGGLSASPDGRWILGVDVRGPRAVDMTTGDVQSWPGDTRNGFWLPDSSGWVEVTRLAAGDERASYDRVEPTTAAGFERYSGYSSLPRSLQWSPSGRLLSYAFGDQLVILNAPRTP